MEFIQWIQTLSDHVFCASVVEESPLRNKESNDSSIRSTDNKKHKTNSTIFKVPISPWTIPAQTTFVSDYLKDFWTSASSNSSSSLFWPFDVSRIPRALHVGTSCKRRSMKMQKFWLAILILPKRRHKLLRDMTDSSEKHFYRLTLFHPTMTTKISIFVSMIMM